MRREQARLTRLFERVLGASLALPLVTAACSRAPSAEKVVDAGSHDASSGDGCSPSASGVIYERVDGAVVDLFFLERRPCGLPPDIRPRDPGCGFSVSDCQSLCAPLGACKCGAIDASCAGGTLTPGAAIISCDLGCIGNIGRRPRGLSSPESTHSGSVVGDHFSRAAHLEAASVHAFTSLRAALRRLGAPADLVAQALSAARDEVRHASIVGRIALRFGGKVPGVSVRPDTAERSLEDVAIENAVEGCVRETYGALLASWQARRAQDAELAHAMREIAADETRHAALSWAIARWALPRLTRMARANVAKASRLGMLELEREVADPHPDLVRSGTLPGAAEQRRMLHELDAGLWSRS